MRKLPTQSTLLATASLFAIAHAAQAADASSGAAARPVVLAAGAEPASKAGTGGVSGRILAANARPLSDMVVEVQENGRHVTTRADGVFAISGLVPGAYTLEVTAPSGHVYETKMTVAADETTQRDITFVDTGTALEAVIVLAQRTPAAIARQAQQQAPNLINIATYQEIRKLPDVTVAEAVRRLPGVSLETDEGEGRYVNIRGLDADLNSTTFGGLRLPPTNNASPFGGYRAVTLDSIPIGLVGAIIVTKSNKPSQDAEALGGTIEITPKTAPRGGQPFIQGQIGSGYEPLRSTPVVNVAVTGGGHFGGANGFGDGPFSVVLTGVYNADWRGIDDVEPSYFNDPMHPYFAINNIQQRDYELHRQRFGGGIDLGYEPNDTSNYYIRAFVAGYTEDYYRQFPNLNPDGNTIELSGHRLQDNLSGATALQKGLRDERETSIDRVFMAGGKNKLGPGTIDYLVGYTWGTYNKAYDYNSLFTFTPAAANGLITYRNSGPGHVPLYNISGADFTDRNNYFLTNFNNSKAYNYDKELTLASNYILPVNWPGPDSQNLQFGGSVRLRHKQLTSQPYSYLTVPGIPMAEASVGNPNEIYYDNIYQQGADINPGYLQSKLGSGTIQPADVLSAQQQYLNAHEDIYAGYSQYAMTAGWLSVLAGVRVEHTRDSTNAFAVGVDQNGTPFSNPVNATNSYTNIFPGAQFRFEIQPRLIGRVTYSSTIARPGFNQITPSLNIDLGSGIVTKGNPALQPATSNSFDLSIEKYLPHSGIISFGLFYKAITNYIVPVVLPNVTLPNNGIYPGNTLPFKVFTFENAPSSYARGLEVNLEKQFTELPSYFSGLGVNFNYTYVDSNFEIRPGESSQLPSTSQNTLNAAAFYEKGPVKVRLSLYWTSQDLFAFGTDKSSDIYNASRTSMDFGSSYAITKNWVIYFDAKNLLNTPHAFYEGTSNRPIQREFYGQTYLIGARFDY